MSEHEYTPTTEDVMRNFNAPAYKVDPQREDEDFAAFLGRTSIETLHASMASEAVARRWLAAHDAEVRREAAAEALRDAARDVVNGGRVSWDVLPLSPSRGKIQDWLEARAAALEGEK